MIVALILLAGVVFSLVRKKLTVAGALTGALLGYILYIGGGYAGLAMMTIFFVLGTAATSWKKSEKRALKPDEGAEQTRTAGQVLANAGAAGMAAMGAWLIPSRADLFQLMIAGAFASATADTLSSELGMVYGRRFFNIVTWRPDRKGLDGVVSMEGLLIGVAGSLVIAGVYAIGVRRFGMKETAVILIAGTIGNLCDSVLGAVMERKGFLSNDAVNFFNTLTAALVAGLLSI